MLLEHIPPGPISQAFHDSDANVRILMGPVGSGKTRGGVVEFFRRLAARKPDADGVCRLTGCVIRNNFSMLRQSTIPSMQKVIPSGMGVFRTGTSPMAYDLKIPGYSMHLDLCAMDLDDDIKRLLGAEYNCAMVDESREILWSIMQTLIGRVGRERVDVGEYSGIWCCSNPSSEEHWMHSKTQGPSAVPSWRLFWQPSGLSPEAENLSNLKPGYYQRLVESNDADWCDVFVRSQFGFVKIGESVFPTYSENFHVAKEPLDVLSHTGLIIGIDFGVVSPSAVWLQVDQRGQYRVLDCLTSEALPTVVDFIGAVLRETAQRFPDVPVGLLCYDPAGSQRSDKTDQTSVDILKSMTKWRCIPSPTNLFNDRRLAVAGLLNRNVGNGEPALILDPRCRVLREAFSSKYAFRTVRTAQGIQTLDEPFKLHPWSDAMDALQYACLAGGAHRDLLDMGKRHKTPNEQGWIWDYRTGRRIDIMTGQPVGTRERATMARDIDYPLFGDSDKDQ